MRKTASLLICLPSSIGPGDHQGKYVRLIDDGCTLEVCVLWPSSLQGITITDVRTNIKTKLEKKGITMEDAMLEGFEKGQSATRVSTVHGVEAKGQIPIGFACTNTFQKCILGWSGWQKMGFYVRLQSHTLESELHFDYNDFSMSSQSDAEDNASAV